MHTFYIVGDSVQRELTSELLELEADESSKLVNSGNISRETGNFRVAFNNKIAKNIKIRFI